MLLELSSIRSPHTAVSEVYSPEAFGPADEAYRIVEPARLQFDVVKSDDRYQLTGHVATVLELPCSRCLEPFRWPVDASFDLVYRPQSTNVGEGEVEVGDEDLSTAFYGGDAIDLGQLMREQFYLALPMKPLCRDDCQGLCPICGQNLNRGTCTCKPQWTDPRLAVLEGLGKKRDS
jgi:uncharacterized protein